MISCALPISTRAFEWSGLRGEKIRWTGFLGSQREASSFCPAQGLLFIDKRQAQDGKIEEKSMLPNYVSRCS